MAYIKVSEGVPGITSLVMFRPETDKPFYDFVQTLLPDHRHLEVNIDDTRWFHALLISIGYCYLSKGIELRPI